MGTAVVGGGGVEGGGRWGGLDHDLAIGMPMNLLAEGPALLSRPLPVFSLAAARFFASGG